MIQTSARLLIGSSTLLMALLLNGSPQKENPWLIQFGNKGFQAVSSGSFQAAVGLYGQGFALARQTHDYRNQTRFLCNIAGAYFRLNQPRQALNTYLEARDLAKSHELHLEASIIDVNLANLYVRFGDLEAADHFADQGLSGLGASAPYAYRHQLLACVASLRARQGSVDQSVSYALEAIIQAAQERDSHGVKQRDIDTMAMEWDFLGEEMLLNHNLKAAEQALRQAFQLRTAFHRNDLRLSLFRLSWLRLEQGDSHGADAFMRQAAEAPGQGEAFPSWLVLYLKARILKGNGDMPGALLCYRQAVHAARAFQAQAAPTSVPGLYAQKQLQHLYADVIDASLSVDPFGLDALEATEEDRASALRQTVAGTEAFLQKAPPEYWDTLSRLRTAQAVEVAHPDPRAIERTASLRQDLETVEVRAGLSYLLTPVLISSEKSPTSPEKNTSPATLRNIQKGLRPEEALLSFHVGRNYSVLWTVTRGRIALHRLAAEPVLAGLVAEFRDAVERRRPDRDSIGQTLYAELFRQLSPEVQRKKLWVITAEDSFFNIPLSALVAERKKGRPIYLVERHTILQTPSAALLNSAPQAVPRGPFLGIGDGIYNRADPRWPKPVRLAGFFTISLGSGAPPLELPRLAGSGKEIAGCARNWTDGSPALLLTGARASRRMLQSAVLSRPSVIHIASHFVTLPQRPDEALIDLGIGPDGSPEMVNEKDIAGLQVPDAVVVMSGCGSGNSRSISTSGVLGLMRAWLIAGARAVIGSRWPTPDDTGELFGSFYRRLNARKSDPARMRSVAESLQEAQIEMLHSQTWRSDPSYWSAFYAIGKE